MKYTRIVESASYLPSLIINNDHLSQIMDTSDEWIKTRTGISQRHISENENTSDLALKVAKNLLVQGGIVPEKLNLIIVATMSPDSYTPSTAAIVQGKLMAENAVAFDISVACSGFVYALEIADRLLDDDQTAIVIGAEVLSKIIDWTDRKSAVLFGDGAGGVLLKKDSTQPHILAKSLKTYGELSDKLFAGKTAVQKFPSQVTGLSSFQMDGQEVYKFATHKVPESLVETAYKANLNLDDLDLFLLHQANVRIIRQIAKRLKQPLQKFPVNIDKYGNTSAASEAILLDECIKTDLIKPGTVFALAGFGGGLTTGSMIIKY